MATEQEIQIALKNQNGGITLPYVLKCIYNAIWSQYPSYQPIKNYLKIDNNLYNYIIPRTIKQSDLMFLGLNPSVVTYKKKTVPFSLNLQQEEIYKKTQDQYIDGCVSTINYFETLRKVAGAIYKTASDKKICWKFNNDYICTTEITPLEFQDSDDFAYYDLLAIRHTNHSDIEKAILKNYTSSSVFTKFINEQLKIAKEVIKYVNPKVIVVCNALASKMVCLNRSIFPPQVNNKETATYNTINGVLGIAKDLQFDNKVGTYVWPKSKSGLNQDVYIFFSGMFSGGALDSGSIERTIFQIANII